MSAVVETILYIFGLVALGYLCGWTGLLKVQTGEALSEFVFTIAIPLLLFRTMAESAFGERLPFALWGIYFAAAAATWTAGHWATRRLFGRDTRAGVVGGVSAAFSNLVLLGVPFVLSIYGEAGFAALSLLVTVHLATMMAASMLLFEWAKRADGIVRGGIDLKMLAGSFLAGLLKNPLIIGILCGLAWHSTGLGLTPVLGRMVDALADLAGPVALFAMGLGLKRFGVSGNVRPAVALAFLKLMVMPALALLLAWLVSLPPLEAKIAVAAASMPAGVNSYLIAHRFGTGQALASNAMTLATGLSAVTTLIWLGAAHAVFG